jgi:hypothetical protein
MSLIKRSDVRNHLSTRSGSTSVFPFGLSRRDAEPDPVSNGTGTKAVETDVSISPSHPISPEAVSNAQVGGFVGVPAASGAAGKRSW